MNIKNSTKRKTLLAGLVGLFAAGGTAQVAAQGGEVATSQSAIDEIIVAASKREKSLQDTAMSVAALSAEDIDKKGLVSMNDYLRTMPGVNMMELGAGRKNPIVIRGIAANPQVEDSTVGVYFGEIPLTASSAGGGLGASWFGAADIKLVDVERVEVLRGPQGTLFGSGSIGGTVRVLPALPDFDGVSANITTGYSTTAENGSGNYLAKGMINLPLIDDELALRAVAYRYKNSGFVKNVAADTNDAFMDYARASGAVVINENDIGKDKYTGGRLTLRWQPTSDFEAIASHMQQDLDQFGNPNVQLALGSYEQSRAQISTPEIIGDGAGGITSRIDVLGHSGLEHATQISNLQLSYDFGWAELMSSSSIMDIQAKFGRDSTSAGLGPIDQNNFADVDTFVEEIRLTSDLDGRLQFIVGLYYEDVDWVNISKAWWLGDPDNNDLATGTEFDPMFVDYRGDFKVEQKAVFGELSYDLTEAFNFTFGGRFFSYDKDQREQVFVPFFGIDTDSNLTNSEEGENLKANLTYKPKDGTLVYAQWSQGFRLGRALPPLLPSCDPDGDGAIVTADGRLIEQADSLTSDTLDSFEIGGKFKLLDNRLTLNTSIYHVDWDGIPIAVFDEGATCGASQNAGKARSRGAEIETTWHISENLNAEFGLSFINAELSEDSGALGNAGDRLPGTPEYNASLSLQYDFQLGGKSGYVRGDYSKVGGFYNNLQELGTEAGDYNQLNMKAGMTFDAINIDLVVNNLTNTDALTWVNAVNTADARAYRLRPRTIGINVSWTY